MAKKPVISKEAQVLLKLLRIALGTEPRKYFGEVVEPFPEGIDWKEVVRLSYEHKVSAIAVDGLEASKYDPYKGLDEKQTEELKGVLVPWIKDVENTEWSYCYYVEVLKTLCQIFRDNGLTPIILKGYGLSLNYPRPSHRGAGDIDIFLIDKDGKPAAEEGVEIVENILNVKPKKGVHDYSFQFKGIDVELHHKPTNPYFECEYENVLIERLTELLVKDIVPSPITGAYFPNPNFYAIYLIRHSFGHFLTASNNLRQYIDWITFLTRYHKDVDWVMIERMLIDAKMKPFAEGLDFMLTKWFNLCSYIFPFMTNESIVEQLTLKKQNIEKKFGRNVFKMVSYFYSNKDKLKLMTGKCSSELFAKFIARVLTAKTKAILSTKNKIFSI